MFGGGGPGGGFLNLGAPEVIVIGAVAWAILGPKELFRLSRQAGEFLGEWQQLGQQAKDQFTSALEEELNADEMQKATASASAVANSFENPPPPPPPSPASMYDDMPPSEFADIPPPDISSNGLADIPPLSEYTASREASTSAEVPDLSDEEVEDLRQSMIGTLGEPSANAANFQEQISGARNDAVLSEYPAELTLDDPADGSPLDVQGSEELLLQNQIDEAENQLATLQAEKSILALKRKQLEANAARARRMAEDRAMEGQAAEQDV